MPNPETQESYSIDEWNKKLIKSGGGNTSLKSEYGIPIGAILTASAYEKIQQHPNLNFLNNLGNNLPTT